jgi:hypothetical protein
MEEGQARVRSSSTGTKVTRSVKIDERAINSMHEFIDKDLPKLSAKAADFNKRVRAETEGSNHVMSAVENFSNQFQKLSDCT